MKVIVTEQQLVNITENLSGFDFDTEAPEVSGFLKKLANLRPTAGSLTKKAKDYVGDQWNDKFSSDDTSTDEIESNTGIPKKEFNILNSKIGYPLGQKFSISSGYGKRTHPVTKKVGAMHEGIDISAVSGTPVLAPLDGVVLRSVNIGGNCGGFVKLSHGNLQTKFCHLREMKVMNGQRVKKGDVIAYSGGGENDPHPGRSTGSHLHYEILNKKGNPIDPLLFAVNRS